MANMSRSASSAVAHFASQSLYSTQLALLRRCHRNQGSPHKRHDHHVSHLDRTFPRVTSHPHRRRSQLLRHRLRSCRYLSAPMFRLALLSIYSTLQVMPLMEIWRQCSSPLVAGMSGYPRTLSPLRACRYYTSLSTIDVMSCPRCFLPFRYGLDSTMVTAAYKLRVDAEQCSTYQRPSVHMQSPATAGAKATLLRWKSLARASSVLLRLQCMQWIWTHRQWSSNRTPHHCCCLGLCRRHHGRCHHHLPIHHHPR